MSISVRQSVCNFIKASVKYSDYTQATYENLFGLSDHSLSHAFLSQIGLDSGADIDTQGIEDGIAFAIKESIRSYNQSKETAIRIYKQYIKYIRERYQLSVTVEFPPICTWISLERQLYIAKLLQNPNMDVGTLADKLLVSERTIEEDIKKLRGNDGNPLQVMGQKLVVEMERDRRGIRFPSTVHPLFLTMNLTQVITMLQGLKEQSQKPGYEEYALTSAVTIWAQLSAYAKDRIMTVSEQLQLDIGWFGRLETAAGNERYGRLFFSETRCSGNEGCGNLLMCIKNGKRCAIEYLEDDDQPCYLENVHIRKFCGDVVICEINGAERKLKLGRVLKSAMIPEGLI